MLLALALLCAFCIQLNFRRAPDVRAGWLAALVTTEFGHILILLPLGLAQFGLTRETGTVRIVVVLLAGVTVIGALRPAWQAWQMSRSLPEQLTRDFGAKGEEEAGPAFSPVRLYFHPRRPLAGVRTQVFANRDGQPLALDYYPAAGAGPAPCLVVIHGGGWDSGDRSQLAEWNHRWASRGWAVAAISYRLAPASIWPAPREDVHAALTWLRVRCGNLGLDPLKIVLLGRSAGGQIATAVAYGEPAARVAGVVALYAPYDMPFTWSISVEDDTLNSARLMRNYLGGPPDTPEREARYLSASAQLLAHPKAPPTLLLQGHPDTLVWYRHARRFAARLTEVGVPHALVELPWATHGFDYNPDGPGGQIADYAIRRFLISIAGRG